MTHNKLCCPMLTKARTPPPPPNEMASNTKHVNKFNLNIFFLMKFSFFFIFSICILKDAEWSKTYVFHERENFCSKGKKSFKFQYFMKISGYPCKNVIKYFSIFSIKKPILFTVRGFANPPTPSLRTGP